MVATESTGSLIDGSMLMARVAKKVLGSSVCEMMEPTLMPLILTSLPSRKPVDLVELRRERIAAHRMHLGGGVGEEQENGGDHQDDGAHDGFDGIAVHGVPAPSRRRILIPASTARNRRLACSRAPPFKSEPGGR